jgi:hypothetical protein
MEKATGSYVGQLPVVALVTNSPDDGGTKTADKKIFAPKKVLFSNISKERILHMADGDVKKDEDPTKEGEAAGGEAEDESTKEKKPNCCKKTCVGTVMCCCWSIKEWWHMSAPMKGGWAACSYVTTRYTLMFLRSLHSRVSQSS